jgi:hypothetical protein
VTGPNRRSARLNVDAHDVGRGLAALVVTILDLVRQLLERQALRRVDAGDLSDDEVEGLGQALLALEDGFAELREKLGLAGEDLGLSAEIANLTDAIAQPIDPGGEEATEGGTK